jgi:hypothetical protein
MARVRSRQPRETRVEYKKAFSIKMRQPASWVVREPLPRLTSPAHRKASD